MTHIQQGPKQTLSGVRFALFKTHKLPYYSQLKSELNLSVDNNYTAPTSQIHYWTHHFNTQQMF
jgi:hypothetical protein